MLWAAFVGLVAYLPSLRGGFLNWDDEDYLRDNLYLGAINARFFEWALTEFHAANWYPLSWFSHALDFAVWGADPFGHHLGNIVVHAVNCALVAALASAWLDRERPPSGPSPATAWAPLIAGVAFALHPIHVEVVSWVSQRKELLCAMFYLGGLLAYLRGGGTRGPRAAAYGGALACHGLALMAKPMAVSFPLVLCLLDAHPLGRWRSPRTAFRSIAEKLPFLLLSAGASVLAIQAQSGGGALASSDELPLVHRLYTAALALLLYARDLLWPAWLAPLHPYPELPPVASPAFLLPLAAVALAAFVLPVIARRRPGIVVATAALVATLLPVLGLVQVGGQARADRYLYLPGVALFVSLGIATARSLPRAPLAAAPALTLVALAWAALTLALQAAWHDSVSLWTRQIAVYPGYAPGYTYRAHALGQLGAFDAAERDIAVALGLPPRSPESAYYLGEMRLRQNRPAEAIVLLETAIRQSQWPDARFHADLGRAYGLLGQGERALAAIDRSLGIDAFEPRRAALRVCALVQAGRIAEALDAFQALTKALPALPPDLAALGATLRMEAESPAAGKEIEEACFKQYAGASP